MGFILDPDAFCNMKNIRKDYETKKKVTLDNKPTLLGMPTFFGGVDIEERANQVLFIEKMLLVLADNLIHSKDHTDTKTHFANLAASRMMLAVCLYIQEQITSKYALRQGTTPVLYRLINEKLGITDTNFLNDEEKALCFDTAASLMSLPNAREEANLKLHESGKTPLSFSEWNAFKDAAIERCVQYKSVKPKNNYPFTSITKPAFGIIFAYAGGSLGVLGGDIIHKSTQILPARYYISAGISGIALTLHTSNTLGVSILAPIIANRFLESFFKIGLGHVGAVTFKVVGQGVGTAIGLPLDMAYLLSLKTWSLLKEKYGHKLDNSNMTGLRISDGMFVINNVAIEIETCADIPVSESAEQIRMEKDNTLYINGSLAKAVIQDDYLDDELRWIGDDAATELSSMVS